jgi:hypothetical protein
VGVFAVEQTAPGAPNLRPRTFALGIRYPNPKPLSSSLSFYNAFRAIDANVFDIFGTIQVPAYV